MMIEEHTHKHACPPIHFSPINLAELYKPRTRELNHLENFTQTRVPKITSFHCTQLLGVPCQMMIVHRPMEQEDSQHWY